MKNLTKSLLLAQTLKRHATSVALFTVLFTLSIGCEPTEEDANQQKIAALENKLLEGQSLRADLNQEYQVDLSNDEYLTFLQHLDSGNITPAYMVMVNHKFDRGQTAEVPYERVFREDYEQSIKNGNPIKTRSVIIQAKSQEELNRKIKEIEDDMASFVFPKDEPSPIDYSNPPKGAQGAKIKEIAQNGTFQDLVDYFNAEKKEFTN